MVLVIDCSYNTIGLYDGMASDAVGFNATQTYRARNHHDASFATSFLELSVVSPLRQDKKARRTLSGPSDPLRCI